MVDRIEEIRRQRNAIARQIDILRGKLEGLDAALRVLSSGSAEHAEHRGSPPGSEIPTARSYERGRVKQIIIDLVAAAGPQGISAQELVSRAEAAGTPIRRDTASSMLSHLKRQGIVRYADGQYRAADVSQ